MLETLMESFDPIIQELLDGLDNVASGCGSDTREHQQAAATTQNNRTVHEGVQHVVSLDENVCPRKWNTSAPACGGVQLDDNYNTGDENSMGATDVLQAVAGCGCVPVQPECSTGARGGVACKYGRVPHY